MSRQASLKSFLATARTALLTPASQRKGPLTFVVGNESAGKIAPVLLNYKQLF